MATDRGKTICKKLKRIRKEIAIINDIVLKQTICTNNEPCIGTCPICEAELLYLEQELDKKRNNGFEYKDYVVISEYDIENIKGEIVLIVEGNAQNFKLTTPDDLALAKLIIGNDDV